MDSCETTTNPHHTGILHIKISIMIPKFSPLPCLQLLALYDTVSVFSSVINLHKKQLVFIADWTEFLKNVRIN
jgi:hypothetical protein